MASVVAKSCSSTSTHGSPVIAVQEKGTRNKRKFRADPPPLNDLNKIIVSPQNQCPSYEFSAENFDCQGHCNGCDVCSFGHNNMDYCKLNLGLSCSAGVGSDVVGANHDADWTDLTESQLEELVLANLDIIFKSAIKKIISVGYAKDVATKAVLRSGLFYGCKDTVSNIVDNALTFLRNGQESDSLREPHFEDLQQMEKYILAELVCVLREVRPFFSTGDAMWCLLISDMNVSHACAMDNESICNLNSNSAETQFRKEAKSSESLPTPVFSAHNSVLEAPLVASLPSVHNSMSEEPTKIEGPHSKSKTPFVLNGFGSEKENQYSASRTVSKSQNHEEKVIGGRKITGINKREYILRQKSVHLEKSYRSYGSKGASRAGKLSNFGGLILDKKLKSVSKTNVPPMLPSINSPPALSVAETKLSLSLPAKSTTGPMPEVPSLGQSSIPYDKSFGRWVPQDKKDEAILKLVPRVRELQNQLQEWTEWANQKVMQAARRLGKDKAELKTLRQEKEEVERLKKEKKTLEENTMKKLSEMENALCKASGQVERANSAVRRLEFENAHLRQEMEAANLRAAEAAASCDEVSKREKKTLMQFRSWEKQKGLFQEELIAGKRKLTRLEQDLELAKELRDQLEARWKQEEKSKEELVSQANLFRIQRQEGEASSKTKEDLTRIKAEKNLQKYKDDIQKLEKEISLVRLKSDSSKIAALRGDIKTSSSPHNTPHNSKFIKHFEGYNGNYGVKRERECVMCLSEEMSVVFLPCAHQVVCTKCNELHEKQGMKDCPSCRGPIQRRICVRYASAS